MSAVADLLRRGWRRIVLSVRRRRRTPVRAVSLAAFCLIIVTLVLVIVLGLDAGRGGVLFASAVRRVSRTSSGTTGCSPSTVSSPSVRSPLRNLCVMARR